MDAQISGAELRRQQGDIDGHEQLVRLERGRVHPEQKLIERALPRAVRTSDLDIRVMNQKHGGWIGVRVVEAKIAAESSLAPHSNICNLRFGAREDRQHSADRWIGFQLPMRYRSADRDGAVRAANRTQFRDRFDIDEVLALKEIVPQQNQQFSAAGVNFGVVAECRSALLLASVTEVAFRILNGGIMDLLDFVSFKAVCRDAVRIFSGVIGKDRTRAPIAS